MPRHAGLLCRKPSYPLAFHSGGGGETGDLVLLGGYQPGNPGQVL